MISDGGWERQRRGAVTNEHPRRGVRQTNSERKGRLNVLGMLPTGLEGALTPSPRATPRASRCLAPLLPPFAGGCHVSVKETSLVLEGKSHTRERNSGEAESAGCLAKTGLPSYLDSFRGGGAAT